MSARENAASGFSADGAWRGSREAGRIVANKMSAKIFCQRTAQR